MSSYDYYVRPVQDISLAHRLAEHIANKDIHFTKSECCSGSSGSDDDDLDLSSYAKLSELDKYVKTTTLTSMNYATLDWVKTYHEANDKTGGTSTTGSTVSYSGYITSSTTGAYLIGVINIDGVLKTIYGKDTTASGGTSGSTVTYTANTTSSETGAYKIGTITINGTSTDIYGHDVVGSSSTPTSNVDNDSWVTTSSKFTPSTKILTLYQSGNGPTVDIDMSGVVDEIPDTDTHTATVAAYIATSKNTDLSTSKPSGGTYDFSKYVLRYPTYGGKTLNKTPQLAIELYGEDDCIVWVSYNTYCSDGTSIGWTTFVKYYDIDAVIDAATTEALAYYSNLLADATSELLAALDNSKEIAKDALDALNRAQILLDSLESDDDPTYYNLLVRLAALESSISSNGWSVKSSVSDWKSGSESVTVIPSRNIIPGAIYTWEYSGNSGYFTPKLGDDGRLYFYTCNESGVIETQVPMRHAASASGDLPVYSSNTGDNILSCAYSNAGVIYTDALMNAIDGKFSLSSKLADVSSGSVKNAAITASYEKILAEVSSVLNSGTDYTKISDAILAIVDNKIKAEVTETDEYTKAINSTMLSMTPTQIVLTAMGGTYSDGETVDTDSVKSSIIDMMRDKLTLSIANSNGGTSFSLHLSENGSSDSVLDTGTFTITGDVISKAIETLTLNVNNKAYIYNTGAAAFGGTSTRFEADGSGLTANGNIKWDASGNITGIKSVQYQQFSVKEILLSSDVNEDDQYSLYKIINYNDSATYYLIDPEDIPEGYEFSLMCTRNTGDLLGPKIALLDEDYVMLITTNDGILHTVHSCNLLGVIKFIKFNYNGVTAYWAINPISTYMISNMIEE